MQLLYSPSAIANEIVSFRFPLKSFFKWNLTLRTNKNKVDSMETGRMVITHLLH